MRRQEEPLQGTHSHPHGLGGTHSHPGLPLNTGKHSHSSILWGGHAHRKGDPPEGWHPNLGATPHSHIEAQGLQEYATFVVSAHWPVHKWIPNFKRAWIRPTSRWTANPGNEFVEATKQVWIDHVMWSLHSAGMSIEQHNLVFSAPGKNLIDLRYEFEDGSSITPRSREWDREHMWFEDNTPARLKAMLKRAIDSDDVENWLRRNI